MPHLLERDHATATLTAAAAMAARGSGATVLVSGEAGIGKSSLVEQFVRTRAGGVLWGCCEALATPRPLGPLYDFGAGNSRITAALRGADRNALFTAVLEEAGRGAPGVLVIEDLHWADEATLDFVKYVARRIHRIPALLLLTARSDGHSWRHVRTILADIPAAHLSRLELQPFSLAAVQALSAADAADARRLHEVTGGNPFFVTELLRQGGTGALPASVQDAVLGRTERLEPGSREVLELAALFPREADHEVLAQLRPGTPQALEDCIASGLLVQDGQSVRFRHELARTAVESGLGRGRAAALHREIVALLEAQGEPGAGRLAQLAHHARLAVDPAAILRWCPRAAADALHRGARREAAAHCRAALAHADRLAPAAHAELLRRQAAACFELGELEAAVQAYAEAAAIHGRLGDDAAQAACLADLAMPLVRSLRNADADVACRQAAALAARSGDTRRIARVAATESYLRMLNRDGAEAIAAGERALALAAPEDEGVRAAALKTMGSALIFRDYEQGCALVERSMDIGRRLDDGGFALTDAHLMIGTASGELHRFDTALRYIDEGLACARAHDLDRLAHYMEAWRALCLVYRGEWDAAGPLALRVLAQEPAGSTSRVVALVALGRLRTRRGDPGAADVLDEALELAERSGTLQRLAPVRAARAEAAWLAGDRVRAAAEARAVLHLAVAKRHAWFTAELAYWTWRAGDPASPGGTDTTPFDLQVRGDWAGAAAAWSALGCRYEQARALAEGDEPARRSALALLDGLHAAPLADLVRRDMRAAGIRSLPRGPLASTRANPAGLTRREVEILGLLAQQLTTPQIAQRLSRSSRTVEHHVESLCAKLGVASRTEAVRAGRRMHLLGTEK